MTPSCDRYSPCSRWAPCTPAPPQTRIDFQTDIVPILATHCMGCHGGAKPRADVNLSIKDEAEARERLKQDDTFWDRVVTEVSQETDAAGRPESGFTTM